MTTFSIRALKWAMAVLVMVVCLPGMVLAACFSPAAVTPEAAQGYQIERLQAGLRTAFGDANQNLQDGRLGAYTQARMVELCKVIPRVDLESELRSTLELANTYGQLAQRPSLPDWRAALIDPKLRALPNRTLRLAGLTAMSAIALGDTASRFDCRGAVRAISAAPKAASTLAKLQNRLSLDGAAALCEAMPVAGGALEFVGAMTHFSQLEARLDGALDDLTDPDFTKWIDADRNTRLLRLAGSQGAVISLLQDYREQKYTTETVTENPCAVPDIDSTLSYYELSAAEIAQLEETLDIAKILDGFAADNPSFGSEQRLLSALEDVLDPVLEDCILPTVRAVVLDDKKLGSSFTLNKEATVNLLVEPELQDSLPVIEAFATASARTEEQLIAGITAALVTLHETTLNAEIELAAETLAAASEPVEPLLDTPAFEIEDLPEVTIPETIGVTDATARAMSLTIKNEAFQKALAAANYLPATVPELLKAEVRAILKPVAEIERDKAVEADLNLIEPITESNWALTPDLRKAILEIPYIAKASSEKTSQDLVERMKPLAGIQYPSNRLFQQALTTVDPISGGTVGKPFSEFMLARLTLAARKTETDPDAPRLSAPLAIEDCACAPFPRTNAEVYGFYPFWFAPLLEDTTNLPEEEEPPAPEKINYELMTRVAFYGLELDFDNAKLPPDRREITLLNENRWGEAKRNFINSAHQHRTAVDVAFDLRNWTEWTPKNIKEAAGKISVQMAPFKRFPDATFDTIKAGIPTLFDSVKADGLTLIFHGYKSNTLTTKQMQLMLEIIQEVYEGLPDRKTVEINVAFDFGLLDTALDEPLFDELFDLLIERTIIVQKQEYDSDGVALPARTVEVSRDTVRIIKRILLFLERNTSDAKKGLRYRMEQGLFQGEQRRDVLRSIVPVVPPTANTFVETSVKAKRVADQRKTFAQFEDDIVYFKDNFAGVGLWPVPKQSDPESVTLTEIIFDKFHDPSLPAVLAEFEDSFDELCTWACPNRAKIALFGMGLFVLTSLLAWRSFYNGRVNSFAFRFLVFGFVGFGNATLVAILLILTNCDRASTMPKILLIAFVAILTVLFLGHLIQQARRGPAP